MSGPNGGPRGPPTRFTVGGQLGHAGRGAGGYPPSCHPTHGGHTTRAYTGSLASLGGTRASYLRLSKSAGPHAEIGVFMHAREALFGRNPWVEGPCEG